MKTKVNNRIEEITKKHEKLFIPFITAGDPTAEATIEIALALEEAGASILELGIPYSDPLADGPTIQAASKRALASGMTLEKAMYLVPIMRKKGLTIPVVIFTYYNPVLQYGVEHFVKKAKELEIDGLLVPDLPIEESEELSLLCAANGLSLISLVAPTSKQRIEKIAEQAQGFLYCVSSLGVTGAREEIDPRVYDFLQTVKAVSEIPIAVGFGISNAKQVSLMNQYSDGVVVGSALVSEIEKLEQSLKSEKFRKDALISLKTFVTSLISS
ncbi:tryptophan synthase subunit alpha [Alkalihalobacillus alcalophilus ATCC 27647 = CGMCC 1.3604]|uniref:Tryptophan synthase alpha chain n=1 Tax=Alkalihalobacillus alcalophilus ATCC 27647 = CGMCC 1.3604 TaxID=1218173 RepID=A0A4S4K321_ALKAL|nr:tryptophan synthase subunit alpha [Alkalihalobacillus alcalophilus]MED1560482.1 tryptophan synthase subunit alpha [Alkalihalobacillus alcalophilus]THG92021.1 tryptophan synthase subunit alpha [Alkalihalobacillus alcalophilus ATCC 27647 = CGMCC 1.3604]